MSTSYSTKRIFKLGQMRLWAPLIIIVGFLGYAKAEVEGLERRYTIDADFTAYASKGRVSLLVKIDLKNQSEKELTEIPIVLFPNRYASELPNLGDLNYRLIYPNGLATGALTILSARAAGQELTLTTREQPYFAKNTLQFIALLQPLKKGEVLTLELKAELKVPKKYGAFGRYKKYLSLSGGWYPYVPAFDPEQGFLLNGYPPNALWDLSIKGLSHLDRVIEGKFFKKNSEAVHRLHLIKAHQLSLYAHPQLEMIQVAGGRHHLVLYIPKSEKSSVKAEFEALFREWLAFVQPKVELTQKEATELVFVYAPIREALVRQGEKMAYVSDRSFKVINQLKQYHTVPILAGLFYQLFFDHVTEVEGAARYDSILEGLSWHWTEQFMAYQGYQNRDARNIKVVKKLSFMPIIDQFIYSPQFAFVDTFYDRIYPYDPVRDDPLRFNHRIGRGRTLYAKLQDYLGDVEVKSSIENYFKQALPLQDYLEKKYSKDLNDVFNLGLAPRPQVNYAIASRRTEKIQGGYHHHVEVTKKPEDAIKERVELGITTKSEKRYLSKWDGEGNRHVFSFETPDRLKHVTLDPRGRLLETDLSDNRRPAKYKFILTQIILNYDVNQSQPVFLLSSQIRKTSGGRNRYDLGFFSFGDVYGGEVGFTRLFGRLIDSLRLTHGVSFSYQFNHVDEDRSVVRDISLSSPSVVSVTKAANLTSVSMSYFTGNQVSFINPLKGGYAGVGATFGSDHLGGDHNYYAFSFNGSWLWPLFKNPSHLLAVRAKLSHAGPEGMPTQAYSRLGGIFNMRGASFDNDNLLGRNLWLTSAEYRHFLKQDLDWNLWLFRVRDIQGAIFSDLGKVSDTLQERANDLVLGTSTRGSFSDLFTASHIQSDVGYGLRFIIDYFGVNPSLIRFDAAKSLTEDSAPLRFYFGVTQSF